MTSLPHETLRVLVLGVGGNVSQGILKALQQSSLPLEIYGADVSAEQAGLFMVDRAFVGPYANAPDFQSWLESLCAQEGIHVVLSGAEPVVAALAGGREQLLARTGARTVVSSPAVIEIGDDKLKTCTWLESQGFPTPRYVQSEDTDGVRRLLETVGYPLIAKPRRGGGARGLFVVEDADALAFACSRRDYIVQECIGADDEEYTVGCFLDAQGVVCGSMVMRRTLHAGTTYRAELGDFPEVRAAAEAIAAALGPEGPCNIQMRVTEAGPVCFEINPRFSGTTPIRATFGFNEAEAALRHFILGEPAAPLHDPGQGVALRYWEELYPDPAALAQLRSEGRTSRG